MQDDQRPSLSKDSEVEDQPEKLTDEKIVSEARERFDLCEEAESEIRTLALEDARFSIGEQWDQQSKNERAQDGRPCLVINRMPGFIHQITNDARQNRPSIKVSPVDDFADLETAKIYQGLIRHIEYASDADTAYDRAMDGAVRRSFGFMRVVSEYSDPFSFYQDLRIKAVRNPHTCFLDPSYSQPDGSDANFGFAVDDVTPEEFKSQWPKSKMAQAADWESLGASMPAWVTKETVRIAEYYYKEFQTKTLVMLSTGEAVLEEQLPKPPEMLPEDITVVAKRQTIVPVVHHLKINGLEILERTIWPGRFIPIIPVLGEEIDIDGVRTLESLVRHAKDPQRMYNYQTSNEAEAIALAPRSPWIGVKGQFEGFEGKWATANRRNHAFLEYNEKSSAGQPVGPPQRNVFEPAIQAISNARMLAAEDLKSTTGIYDASLGAGSQEKSGVAIQRRNNQAQTSNFHFVDNLSKSIRHVGRILVDAIPIVYDTARAVRILGETGEEEVIRINEQFDRKGKPVNYQLNVGKYDVAVDTGPSFETKRQEAVASQIEMVRAFPQAMQLAGDIIVKNMDWPGAKEISERMKKSLPPGIAEDEKSKQPIPPQVQQKLQSYEQLIDQLTNEVKEHTQITAMKTMELESKERIEMAKLQVQLEMKMADIGSKESMALLAHEVSEIQTRLGQLGINEPIEAPSSAQPAAPAQPQMENGSMGDSAPPNLEQPTGGPSPGNYVGETP